MRDFRMANKGMTLEAFLTFANKAYERDHQAVIWKVPTAFKPIRNAYGQVVNCKVEGKSCVDYLGRVGDRPIAMEAKETQQDNIQFLRVEDHQAEFMDAFTEHQQGLGLVVVSFSLERFYAIPWECWKAARDAWKAAQRAGKRKAEQVTINYHGEEWTTPGKASVKESELLESWRVDTGGRYGLDYLKRYRNMPRMEADEWLLQQERK